MLFRKTSFRRTPLANPQRILIVRFSAIGDVIHSLPLVVALRTRFPSAEIAWLVEEKAAAPLQGHWALDRLILIRKNWMKSLSTISLLRNRLQAYAPDVTVDPQGLLKSSFAAWLSGAKYRVGFGGLDGREGSRFFNNCRVVPDAEHVVDRNMQLLEPFGVHGSSVSFDLAECEMDRHSARNMLDREGLHGNFAILNVGAGWPSKLWREDRYAKVARYLLEQWNLPSLVLWAGKDEQAMAENVTLAADGAAFMAPKTSLGELASLCRAATIFIGSDTGPLHMAAAVGTPCIGLYGPVSARRNGPYGPDHRWIQATPTEQQPKRRNRTSRHLMDLIEPEAVCQLCDEILMNRQEESNASIKVGYGYRSRRAA